MKMRRAVASQVPLLCLLLMAPMVGRSKATEVLKRRSLFLSGPAEAVPEIHVSARAVTLLRFQHPLDPLRTSLQVGEGLFEPLLVSGSTLVITPLRELAAADRVSLTVTLEDGKVVPLTLVAAKNEVDAQVDVFSFPESSRYLRAMFEEKEEEARRLQSELQVCREEETSMEHLQAGLLAANAQALTPFRLFDSDTITLPDWKVRILRMRSSDRFVFVFLVTNLHSQKPWELGEVRFTNESTGKIWNLAVRASPSAIPPGQTGRVAVVSGLFPEKMRDRFLLELTRKDDQQFFQLRSLQLLILKSRKPLH